MKEAILFVVVCVLVVGAVVFFTYPENTSVEAPQAYSEDCIAPDNSIQDDLMSLQTGLPICPTPQP